jgi:CHASE2 domain-containing sensor protein
MDGVVADGKSHRGHRFSSAGRGLLIATGLGLTLVLALLLIFRPDPIHQAELRTYDLMLSGRRIAPHAAGPVLVGIDEESLAAYGQWPWPRYRLAMLVDRLQQLGAAVVALDLLMQEPDRSSPEVIRAERKRDGLEDASLVGNEGDDSNSRSLAVALARGRTVLAAHLDYSGTRVLSRQSALGTPEGMIVTRAQGGKEGWPKPTGVIRSLPVLTAAAAAEGYTNTLKDIDGTLRRTPLLLDFRGQELPSLALAAMLVASSERHLRLSTEESETFLHWDDRHIPLDQAGNLMLGFRDPGQPFPYYSASAVLKDGVAADSLRGRIVLVGPWATGLGDLHLAPAGRWLRGLEVHATIVDNLLTGDFIARPGWARGAELFALLFLGVASTLLLSRSGFGLSLLVVILGSLGCYWGSRQLLMTTGLALSPLLPMLTPVIITTCVSLLKYGIEARKVREGVEDLIHAQDEVIVSLSVLSEARDNETGLHIVRTQRYVEILARDLAARPKYGYLTESSIRLLAKSAPLHDIGKVGIPDAILRKPGKLTAEEYEIMKSHTTIGANALARIVGTGGCPEDNEFLDYARQMTECHHEHWDGSGYPSGLRGEAIPLAGRLMALADVYDALISRRVYKEAHTHDEVRAYIRQQSGAHFDPEVVAAFMARDAEFLEVARQFAEGGCREAGSAVTTAASASG